AAGRGNDFEEFKYDLMRQLSIEPNFDEAFFKSASDNQIADKIAEGIREMIARRTEVMIKQAWPIIDHVYKNQTQYINMALPITDGAKGLNLVINLKRAYESEGKEITRALAKSVTLAMIDEHWKEHLREMDDLKQSVQNASYEQKDPLLIYKFESFNLFKSVLEKISRDVISVLVRAHIPFRQSEEGAAPNLNLREQPARRKSDMSNMQTSRSELSTNSGEPKSNAPVHVEKKVGRNDPCPCGSGKKYKNCHGREA
ncbi:MAG: SEC-C domain-containing protein, partial [Bacteroidales bacterium]|nr:SEC-C domain-containing protein [Bacteroidales bacterium]